MTQNGTSNRDQSSKAFIREYNSRLKAGYPVLYVPTNEEVRAEALIAHVAMKRKLHTCVWDIYEGFSPMPDAKGQPEKPSDHRAYDLFKNKDNRIVQPLDALRAIDNLATEGIIFIMRDLLQLLPGIPPAARAIRTFANSERLINNSKKQLVLISPYMEVPSQLRSSIHLLDLPLPDAERLEEACDFILRSAKKNGAADPEWCKTLDDGYNAMRPQLTKALLGFTVQEATHALSRAVTLDRGFKPSMLKLTNNEKAELVKKNGVLTYIDEDKIINMNEIGGFEHLLKFVGNRAAVYSDDAMAAKIDRPKGIVLAGVAGTGKSVVGMAISKMLNRPLYILDVGSLFGSLVGESEARLREAIRQIEAQRGAVLLIDEVDKGFGGAHQASGDSGVTRRVFGSLLTWLATKQDETFVVVTLNRTDGLPPEFLRAGRFDSIFYTDLPGPAERLEILRIHLTKRGVNMDDVPAEVIKKLVQSTDGYVGAELEQIVVDARAAAWASRRSGLPTIEEFLEAASGIHPLAKRTDSLEDTNKIRDWCQKNARPASEEKPDPFKEPRKSKTKNLIMDAADDMASQN